MTPTKIKDLIPSSAEQLGISQDDLSNMVSFYFKENRNKMSRLEHLQFVFRGLAVMKIKGWNIQKEIDNRNARLPLAVLSETVKQLNKEIVLYTAAKDKWIEQEKAKAKVRELKKQYYANKTINNELEGETTTGLE